MAKGRYVPELGAMVELPEKLGGRIGLLGGTFDPVHMGHLAAAEKAKETFRLDAVLFIPAVEPPHKLESDISSFADRVAMIEQALVGRSGFFVSCLEAERQGPSYTIDTLTHLRRQVGEEVRLFFIIGADAFAEIASWKQYGALLDYTHFVVMKRDITGRERIADVVRKYFPGYMFDAQHRFWGKNKGSGNIYLLEMKPVAVSSTGIRQSVRLGRSIGSLVPEGVAGYIREHRLYA